MRAAGPVGRALPSWARWLHLYASMVGLAALLFFSVTGVTLNHPGWMLGSRRSTVRVEGQMDAGWLAAGRGDDAIDRLRVVEHLRREHGVGGLVDDFRAEGDECAVAFKAPGASTDVVVDRRTGRYRGSLIREGWVAVVNDLHKGRNAGRGWGWMIDLSGGLLAAVAVTGLWLLWQVRRRRVPGLWTGLVGGLAMVAAWWWWVR